MIDKIDFVLINIFLPLVLSIVCSKNPKKQQTNYEITKGVWYLIYGGVVVVGYLLDKLYTRYVVGFTVTIAIMEGAPLLLKRIFSIDADSHKTYD